MDYPLLPAQQYTTEANMCYDRLISHPQIYHNRFAYSAIYCRWRNSWPLPFDVTVDEITMSFKAIFIGMKNRNDKLIPA